VNVNKYTPNSKFHQESDIIYTLHKCSKNLPLHRFKVNIRVRNYVKLCAICRESFTVNKCINMTNNDESYQDRFGLSSENGGIGNTGTG
jgi:hypothetical protein